MFTGRAALIKATFDKYISRKIFLSLHAPCRKGRSIFFKGKSSECRQI